MDTNYVISSEGTFDAAHSLPYHKGRCSNLHGHTWRYEVEIKGPKHPKKEMVMDFGDIDAEFDRMDHCHLNEKIHPEPTCENLVKIAAINLYSRFVKFHGGTSPDYVKVTLWESPRHKVTYTKEE